MLGPALALALAVMPASAAGMPNAHGGEFSCRLAATGMPVWGGPSQQVEVPRHRKVVFRAWIRGGGQRVELALFDTSWKWLGSTTFLSSSEWSEAATPAFDTATLSRVIVQLRDTGFYDGNTYFDDLFCGEPGGRNLLANPGFERKTSGWGTAPGFSIVRGDEPAPPAPPPGPPAPDYAGPVGLHVPPGWQLVFSDDFSAASLDRSKWLDHLTCFTDHLNDELERYRPYGIVVGGGLCTLRAEPAKRGDMAATLYSSGVIVSRAPFRHGYFEARIQLPPGKGFWPAFWLTSAEERWPPEWDILEAADVPGRLYGYPHPVDAPGAKCEWVEGAARPDGSGLHAIYEPADGAPAIHGEFVTYGFRWTSTDIVWYVNDVMTEHYAVNAAAGSNDRMWLILNLAVGGKWPGHPDSSTPWPGDMRIDYVKVWSP